MTEYLPVGIFCFGSVIFICTVFYAGFWWGKNHDKVRVSQEDAQRLERWKAQSRTDDDISLDDDGYEHRLTSPIAPATIN